MIEFFGGLSGLLAVLLVIAVIFALSYRRERDEMVSNLNTEHDVVEALENRVRVLRGDNEALVSTVAEVRKVNDALYRENGRLLAERLAAKPKRGPNGKFVSKKAKAEKPKPVSCG